MSHSFPADHPRAAEILELASSPADRAKLEALLLQEGLPQDLFVTAGKRKVDPKGEVLIGGSVCPYTITEHVMEIEGAFSLAKKVVDRARKVNRWGRSTQVNRKGSYTNENRTSWGMPFSEANFGELEQESRSLLNQAATFYQCFNPGLTWSSDGDWEVVRYAPTEAFGSHVDLVASMVRRRMLSVLVYLNDDFEEGGTQFNAPGPELLVQPKAGKVVLFPPFYTHPHEGLPVKTGTKYVLLGWLYA